MVFTSKHNMEVTISEKLLKKTKENFGRDFFRYDLIQEMGWFRTLLTHVFKKVFTSKHDMKMTKSENLLEETTKKPSEIFSI